MNNIINGDCIEELKKLGENSVDAIVTDPPYGLEFMGKEWDKFRMHDLKGETNQKRFEDIKLPRFQKEDSNQLQSFCQLWAKECLRVLKPGGFLLSFGGTRTYHRMVCGIEDAGFEIRDTIMWLYGSGFPKSLNIGKQMEKLQNAPYEMVSKLIIKSEKTDKEIADFCGVSSALVRFWRLNERSIRRNEWIKLSELLDVEPKDYFVDAEREVKESKWRTPSNKPEFSTQWGFGAKTDGHYDITIPETDSAKEWEGWGTALKPAVEPIVVARKPLSEKNVALNVLKWGTGGINIGASRIETNPEVDDMKREVYRGERDKESDWGKNSGFKNETNKFTGVPIEGRFPANIILDEEAGRLLDEQSGESVSRKGNPRGTFKKGMFANSEFNKVGREHNDKGGASRFFYCAKASKGERNFGLDDKQPIRYEDKKTDDGREVVSDRPHQRGASQRKNNHPTVKPIKLMEYLIELVSKEGATILDPFLGSGTTGIAATKLNRKFIGIEKEEEYIKIAKARIKPFLEQTKLSH